MYSKLSRISEEAEIGRNARIYDFVNIYGRVKIGEECVIGAFVEMQPWVEIGDRVKISSHTYICNGIKIKDDTFIGHGVMFSHKKLPRSADEDERPITAADHQCYPSLIKRGTAIGSGSTIGVGVTIR